mgnify:CR=1 FL=1
MRTVKDLQELQALPLNLKIRMTESRIRSWVREFGENGVYISFSGGKDSTVLLDIIRNRMGYTNIPAVFVDVPTQYPELRDFANTFDNVTIIEPKISFMEVCEKYGFPLISKEVSECVYGARKYLKSILQKKRFDRQEPPYRYWYGRVTGKGAYQRKKSRETSLIPVRNEQNPWNLQIGRVCENRPPGYDNKYRKLRGIGEYSQSAYGQQRRWEQSKISDHAGNADKGQGTSDKGEYP